MWTETIEDQEFVKNVSKLIVIEIAPEELDIFDELVSEYYKNPISPSEIKIKESPLGFGTNEIIVAVTTASVAMVKTVLNYLTAESIKAVKEESTENVKKKIKALFSSQKEQNTSKDIPPLSKEQLKVINKLAIKEAIDFGISPKKAENLAKALIGALNLKQ